jgi:DNA polymerase V
LAKLSNHLAKKTPGLNGVCDLTALDDDEVAALMAKIDVGEVWGVGRRLVERLQHMNIRTVLDLRNAPLKTIRQQFGVTVERTCMELRGISCIALEEVAPVNQQIIRAKSFGQKISSLREVEEAVCTNLARAVDALRRQHLLCGALQVFVETDRFREDEPQYSAGRTIPLPSPSDDIRVLTTAAAWALRRIYKPGFLYKKGGVMLTDLRAQEQRQEALFGSQPR